jgi:hypothetical protein
MPIYVTRHSKQISLGHSAGRQSEARFRWTQQFSISVLPTGFKLLLLEELARKVSNKNSKSKLLEM